MPNAALAQWLKSLPGRRITGLIFVRFVYNGDPRELQVIEFELDGVPAGKLDCASDGETLRHSPEAAKPVDMGEAGANELFERLDGIDSVKVIGATIQGIDLFCEGGSEIGIALKLSSGAELLIFNWGDDLVALLGGDHAALRDTAVVRRRFA